MYIINKKELIMNISEIKKKLLNYKKQIEDLWRSL